MTKEKAVICYQASMSIFIKWFNKGIITKQDLAKVEEVIAEKYKLPIKSIYRYKA